MNNIVDLFSREKSVQDYSKHLTLNKYNYLVNSATPNHGYLLTYLSFLKSDGNVFYIASNLYKANLAYEAFCKLSGYDNVNLYVADEIVSAELLAVSADLKYERLSTVKNILKKEKNIIVSHVQALLKPVFPKERFLEATLQINVKTEINLSEFINEIISLGYKRVPTTTMVGDFSVRGEIIDIFPIFSDNPIRINLFDTEVESIKFFDPETQKSSQIIDVFDIFPLNEIFYGENEKNNIIDKISNSVKEYPNFLKNDLFDLENYNNLERMSKYLKYFSSGYTNLLEYSDNKIVFYEDYQRLEENYEQLRLDLENYLDQLSQPQGLELFFFFDFSNLFYRVEKKIFLSEFKKSLNQFRLDKLFDLNGIAVIDYQNDVKSLIGDLKANPNKTFVFAFYTEERLNLLKEILTENNLEVKTAKTFNEVRAKRINLIRSDNALSFGFLGEIEVYTEQEIFKRFRGQKARYRSVIKNTKPISSKEDLQVGDYVVHYDYGIGKYLGIKTVELQDIRNDYIVLQYANMELYITVEKIVLLEKYQGSESVVPKLTSIGKGEWERKKRKIQAKLESISADIIDLQAQREELKGYHYPADGEFQKMFEDDFEYEETPDQLKTILEIKRDMEAGKIIDRLICGDVGYGKTEIAMRIAFKTVFSNKQVIYLAPTTILTRQHYFTFKERFEKYGIRAELLNRLVPKKNQKEILKDYKAGLVDILIGTHRVLSDDVKARDLGLLIVDEEQRFGVVHKEKIKRMKTSINVLTLTATPIPRTLQMSIMGVRQLSLIETPPKDRYPVQTYVIEANDIVIKEAIYREISRGGQVFYLHNRIDDLDYLYRRLRRLVPEAKICIAHGRMTKNQLEDTMQAFIDREYDVLLCTTIIETGIDIPNTNTLIIDGAEYLGLSQIYQIRGRVGRTDRVAYAYLMYSSNKVLTDEANKRLSAIKEFTNLGSGYRIAVRDLSIRGAGDILGKEQSGFIDAIGLDMYMKMLNEAMNKVRNIEPQAKQEPYLIDVSKHVDEAYVSDDEIKILIHKEIYKVKTAEDKLRVISEFTDRFGKLNQEILTYIEERYLQTLLKAYDVKSVLETQYQAMIVISKEITKNLSAESIFMKAAQISPDFNFEYKRHQLIIKIKKEPKDKSWIFKFTELLESQLKNMV
ncbi:MAG: transcription-repair coupling factor [Bacilli bacterium]|nr:transcription-repair coupling factor [Bacilli bacterium]